MLGEELPPGLPVQPDCPQTGPLCTLLQPATRSDNRPPQLQHALQPPLRHVPLGLPAAQLLPRQDASTKWEQSRLEFKQASEKGITGRPRQQQPEQARLMCAWIRVAAAARCARCCLNWTKAACRSKWADTASVLACLLSSGGAGCVGRSPPPGLGLQRRCCTTAGWGWLQPAMLVLRPPCWDASGRRGQ